LLDVNETLPHAANITLDSPITMEDLLQAVKKGSPNKAPGSEGKRHYFFRSSWSVIKHMITIIIQIKRMGR
jgi:hypothetical protein